MRAHEILFVTLLVAGLTAVPEMYAQDNAATDDGAASVMGPVMHFGRGNMGGGAGLGFIDENGNGISDRLEDADGDGVVNALDPDSKLYRDPTQSAGFGHGLGFVDEDGDGINDRLQDADGDGIINALDPDSKYYRDPASRGGRMSRGIGFIDEDGDGIADRLQDADGDGTINALDPDSDHYRNPAARGGMRRGGGMRSGVGRR